MLTKDKMHELIDQLPDVFSSEDLIGEIILLQKLEVARKEVQNGDFLTDEEFGKEIDSW